jgi:hypothetical protein
MVASFANSFRSDQRQKTQRYQPHDNRRDSMASAAVMVVESGSERSLLALDLLAETSFDEWVAIGRRLCLGSQAINWHIGDWWNFGIRHWGEDETRKSAQEIWGIEGETARVYGWVAGKFDPVTRVTALSFRHYQEVAALAPSKAHSLLEQAAREGWSKNDLRSHISSGRKEAREASPLNQFPVQERLPSIAQG